MTKPVYLYRCPVLGILMISNKGCEKRRKRKAIEYMTCHSCKGPKRLPKPLPVDESSKRT